MIERTDNISIPVMINRGNIVDSLEPNVMSHKQIPPPTNPPIVMVFLPTMSEICPTNGDVTAPPNKNTENASPVNPGEKPFTSWKNNGAMLINATMAMLWSTMVNRITKVPDCKIDRAKLLIFGPIASPAGGAITIGANLTKINPKIMVGIVLI
jgi:hypothetical protein